MEPLRFIKRHTADERFQVWIALQKRAPAAGDVSTMNPAATAMVVRYRLPLKNDLKGELSVQPNGTVRKLAYSFDFE